MTLLAFGWTEARRAAFAPHASEGLSPGRVIGEHRTHYRVAFDGGETDATLVNQYRTAAKQRSDLPGVGDFVALRPSPDDGLPTIEAVLPRATELLRKASGEERAQLLAANVDFVFIVMALDGDFNLPRLQRYLTLVEASRARPVIVANKADLAEDLAARLAALATTAPGIPAHALTARDGHQLAPLSGYFDGNRTIALIGSSGVGKSTITNKLLGRDAQATQDVRAHDSRGRHTTTHRQLFLRPQGGSIMDTPGMRGLEMWDPDDRAAERFDDIENLALGCKFSNCRHGREPGCKVRAAVERGEIEAQHLAAFVVRAEAARKPRW